MKKSLIISAFFVGISLASTAQQIPAYHHYFMNGMVFNPAATGYFTSTNAFFMRNQRYIGFEGGNIVNALTVDGSLYDNKLGLGISLYSDVMGASSSAGGLLSGSYKVKFSDNAFLRFGVAAGVEDYRINYNQAIVRDPNDKQLNNFNAGRALVPNVNAGILLQIKAFQFGLSVPQLIGLNSDFKALVNEGSSNGGGHTFDRHYLASARYDINISEKTGLKVSPFALVKFVPDAPIYYDGGFVLDFRDFVWLNATYKANYGVTAALGFKIKKSICIGYAYDVVTNSTKSMAGINQEILVGYRFPQKDNSKEKKELEEAQKKIEQLNNELLVKKTEIDTLHNQDSRFRKQADDKYNKMQSTKNDSINKLNELLAKKNQEKPAVSELPVNTTKPENFDMSNVKRSENDHFLEMDNSESPQGLYVVFGAFGNEENAKNNLNQYQKDFPEARMILNERNGYRYIILKYSLTPAPIFEVQRKAHGMGLSKAWILEYVKK